MPCSFNKTNENTNAKSSLERLWGILTSFDKLSGEISTPFGVFSKLLNLDLNNSNN